VTTLVVLASSTLLALMFGVVEFSRGHVRGKLDFLRVAGGVYLICFAVAPVYLQLADLAPIRAGQWSWMLRTPFHDPVFAYASVTAVIGYAFMLGGYWLVRPRGLRPEASSPMAGTGYLWLAGVGLGLLGLVSLVVYATSVGGWIVFFVEALSFRSNNPPVVSRWAFLTNVAPLVIGAVVIFFALRQYHGRGAMRRMATFLCAGFFAASLAILFHQAGRAAFMVFLVTLPLIRVVQRDSLRLSQVIVGALLFTSVVLLGRYLFFIGRNPSAFLTSETRELNVIGALRAIIWEFSFPIVTLANVIRALPGDLGMRWFYDIPLAIVYLVPQRLTGVMHEPTVTMVNTTLFGAVGGIPVDLLSFGYYSLLLPGALMAAAGLGMLLGVGERLFPPGPDPMRAGLRVSWILLLALRVMYADPQLFWRSGLSLLLTTVAVMLPGWLRKLLPPARTSLAARAGIDDAGVVLHLAGGRTGADLPDGAPNL
jgi:hypothetical protein